MGVTLFEDFGGNWDAYLEAVHDAYIEDMVRERPTFGGTRVNCRRVPEHKGKGSGFWHVTSEGAIEDERLPDLRRCERIRWIRYAIDNAGVDPGISIWENERGRETNVLLWVEEEYLIVLAKRSDYYLLRTAYCTDKPHNIRSLRKERDAWIAAQKG